MIINHNMNAMNAHRQMSANTVNSGKSMEKLSSGLRINRAGDDAAGLAISEKMRGQIRGLDQASRNSQDAISMIQTAEGGLNETHSILQRMRELGVQAGNDTNTDKDRLEIQKEINQLTSEINRIGNTTEFNNQSVLKGNADVKATNTTPGVKGEAAVTAKESSGTIADLTIKAGTENGDKGNIKVEVKVASDDNLAVSWGADGKLTISLANTTDSKNTANLIETAVKAATANAPDGLDMSKFTVTGTLDKAKVGEVDLAGGVTGKAELTAVANVDEISGELKAGEITVDGKKLTIAGDDQDALYKDLKAKIEADTDLKAKYTVGAYTDKDNKITLTQASGKESSTGVKVQVAEKSFTMQVGANENQTMTLAFEDMRANNLGLTGTGDGYTKASTVTNGTNNDNVENALDVSNSKNAGNAVTKIQDAINQVSAERSKLGAYQNRLEHTINNLGTSSENLTSAESRIRDVDMAKEMMTFSKNNILAQAAQAMLAQANQQPQGVLQLLR
ncbi:flagellin [Clostridium botulinum]|uniref:Flagellin n=1 Tax=Clostridium botulinum TaxID=1491 RepID=A0A6B4JQW6_CLOBO|nr:flagellin [Clostridium botulinum]EES47773.1 FlaB [Clostridium botulinum E1 str. 'BoNT E Beluga']MBY6762685.1 FlaB [Clostridium botulinum]MBY6921470.1 FlaB [Clostridium botulinum]MCR1132299.1 flagellin [Clostridium botulinum]NFJ59344.1 FlaB [Clostridium botulinum]